MLEMQLQQQQEAMKQAVESKRQRDSDKCTSLERQVRHKSTYGGASQYAVEAVSICSFALSR